MKTRPAYVGHLFCLIILIGFFVISFNNYLLFHTLAELTSIAVAWCIFMIAWNTRTIAKNAYFLTIGVAYLWIGGLDLLHTLSYKGMGLFPGYDANLPTQLWIAARYLEGLSLLAALGLMDRAPKAAILMPLYGVISTAAAAAALGGVFPDCYVEGVGLTSFKIVSEWVICLLLVAAAGLLRRRRTAFDPYVFRLLAASIGLTIGAELAFTFYVSVYGLSNLAGHFFKLGSFYLIYLALVETGLRNPFSIVFRDLRLSQAALRESEQKFKTLIDDVLDSSKVGIFILDSAFRVVWINKAISEYFGLDREGVIGRDKKQAVRDRIQFIFDDPEAYMEKVVATYENNTYMERFECHVLPGDGRQERWLQHWSQPIEQGLYRGGRIEHYYDITERKEAEEQLKTYLQHLEEMVEARTRDLREAQAELIVKERLAVLGHFAGNVSHELRNPLGAIGASAYLLRMKFGAADEKIREHVGRIESNVAKSDAIIESLLNLSRMEKPKTARTDLTAFLPEALRTVKIPSTVETALDLPAAPVFADIDPEQIRMAVKNIVQNAIQAMDDSGTLSMSIRDAGAGRAELVIADTGPGIAPDYLEKVFDPLFSTKTHGIGFGLSITKMIVENHGGTVLAESPTDGGARFVMTFPQARPARF